MSILKAFGFWLQVYPQPGMQTCTKAKLWAVSKCPALSSWAGLIPESECQGFPPRRCQAWPLAPSQSHCRMPGPPPCSHTLAIWESPCCGQSAACGSVPPHVLPRCCFPVLLPAAPARREPGGEFLLLFLRSHAFPCDGTTCWLPPRSPGCRHAPPGEITPSSQSDAMGLPAHFMVSKETPGCKGLGMSPREAASQPCVPEGGGLPGYSH